MVVGELVMVKVVSMAGSRKCEWDEPAARGSFHTGYTGLAVYVNIDN